MAGRLKVIGTPIGNLADLSPRAQKALQQVEVILAENPNHSRPLLTAVGVNLDEVRLVKSDQHNELRRLDLVQEVLEKGSDVALISDAGAPGISDPGGRLVDAVVAAGFEVEVLPGPTAMVAALMGAGLRATHFIFLGFIPKKGKARRTLLEKASSTGFATVLYEAPHRVAATLKDLAAIFGPRRVVVGRELTKLYETFHRGELGGSLSPELVEKGEAVIVVEEGDAKGAVMEDDAEIDALARELAMDRALRPRDASRMLAEKTGLSANEAYQRIAAIKKKT